MKARGRGTGGERRGRIYRKKEEGEGENGGEEL